MITVSRVIRSVGKPIYILPVNDADKLKTFVEAWEKRLCDWLAEYKKILDAIENATGTDKTSLEKAKQQMVNDYNSPTGSNWGSKIRQIKQARAALRKLGIELADPCDLKIEQQ